MQRLTDINLRGAVGASEASAVAPSPTPSVTRRAATARPSVVPTPPRRSDARPSRVAAMEKRLEGLGVRVFAGAPGPAARDGVYVLPNGHVVAVGSDACAATLLTRDAAAVRRAARRVERRPSGIKRKGARSADLDGLYRTARSAVEAGLGPDDVPGTGRDAALARSVLAIVAEETGRR